MNYNQPSYPLKGNYTGHKLSLVKSNVLSSSIVIAESEVFISKDNLDTIFECKINQHPEILKKHLQNAVTLETMVILDMILGYVKRFDKNITDPIWETVSLRIKKYKPFLNIDESKCKQILREIVL